MLNNLQQAVEEATRIAERHEAANRMEEARRVREHIAEMKRWIAEPDIRPHQGLYDEDVARMISDYHIDMRELPV